MNENLKEPVKQVKERVEKVDQAKGLARWFSVDVKIAIFGVTIWEYHFPPKNND